MSHPPATSYLPTPEAQPPAELAQLVETLTANVAGVFLGKPEVIRFAVIALLVGLFIAVIAGPELGWPPAADRQTDAEPGQDVEGAQMGGERSV